MYLFVVTLTICSLLLDAKNDNNKKTRLAVTNFPEVNNLPPVKYQVLAVFSKRSNLKTV